LFTAEVCKWVIKKLMRRRDVVFPAYAELRSRSLPIPFASNTARRLLGWTPVEDRETFLARVSNAVRQVAGIC
jgi:hypothetical protein